MKLTVASLNEMGLNNLVKGTQIRVPSLFSKKVDLLFDCHNEIIAFMHDRYLLDYRIVSSIMIVLNQLVRHYQLPITLYCISYRSFVCGEIIYQTFKKAPILDDNSCEKGVHEVKYNGKKKRDDRNEKNKN